MSQQAQVVDLRPTIVPKSDQLNADDLIGQSLTIKVTQVALTGDGDQPFAIHYEGDNGKPFKPCKSMRRVMVSVWGSDGHAFIGRRMTLYRDEKVQFGGQAVGGIRISHMSDIDRDITMPLTATRGHRKPYTVKALPAPAGKSAVALDVILAAGRAAAARGSVALTAWWGPLSKPEKLAAKPTLDSELKPAASKADLKALDDEIDPETGEIIDDATEASGEAEFTDAAEAPTDAVEATGGAPDVTATGSGTQSSTPPLPTRIAAFKKRCDEATTTVKLQSIWNASAGLRTDIDAHDPEELPAAEKYWSDRYAAVEAEEQASR